MAHRHDFGFLQVGAQWLSEAGDRGGSEDSIMFRCGRGVRMWTAALARPILSPGSPGTPFSFYSPVLPPTAARIKGLQLHRGRMALIRSPGSSCSDVTFSITPLPGPPLGCDRPPGWIIRSLSPVNSQAGGNHVGPPSRVLSAAQEGRLPHDWAGGLGATVSPERLRIE
jgi:hypothetical protein